MTNKPLRVNCPTCNKQHTYDQQNPHRPFCSERCKLIDLGEWASEGHRIAGDDAEQKPDDNDDAI